MTIEEVERVAAENHKYLEVVDRTGTVADKLDLLGALLETTNGHCVLDIHAANGLVFMLSEGAEAIRELAALVQSVAAQGNDGTLARNATE